MFFKLIAYTLFWCILWESFSPWIVCLGICLSYLTHLFITSYLPPIHRYTFSFTRCFNLFSCFIVTFYMMYRSSFKVMYLILKGHPTVCVCSLDTTTFDPLYFVLTAHTITLTPGTISLLKKNHTLEFLSFVF